MKPKCPHCDSLATEKLSAGYAKGMRASDTHISYSAWAQLCAPPEPKTVVGSLGYLIFVIFLMVGGFVFEFGGDITIRWDLLRTPYFGGLTLIGLTMVCIVIVRFFRMLHHMAFEFKEEYELWERQWACRDCAQKFVPETR